MKKHWKALLLSALFAASSLHAQDIKLHTYFWRPVSYPTTNILVSWDGPCGLYTVKTNANIGDTNGWGTYSTVDRHWWLNSVLMTTYTIGAQQLFFRVEFTPDTSQDGCTEAPILIITHPYDQPAYTNTPVLFHTYSVGSEGRVHQWYKDGVAISGATNMDYRIDRAVPSDEAEYYMTVSNSLHVVTSQVAYLTVLEEEYQMPPPSTNMPFLVESESLMGGDLLQSEVSWLLNDPYADINPVIQKWLAELEAEAALDPKKRK